MYRYKSLLVIALLPICLGSIEPLMAQSENPVPSENEEEKLSQWDRLIYVPFSELQKVFDNQDASAVLPYREYLELLRNYLQRTNVPSNEVDAVILKSVVTGKVEKDVAGLQIQMTVRVLKQNGWARLPLSFGDAAVGKVVSSDDDNVLLQGTGDGQYQLMIRGPKDHKIELELLTRVVTSPESRSIHFNSPVAGISELTLTIPEAEQEVEVTPLKILLPVESEDNQSTVVRANVGATGQINVTWRPKTSSRPVMDLLATVDNQTSVQIDPGLIQSTAVLEYSVLRGELNDATVLVPAECQVIDVVSSSGRIRSWEAKPGGSTHQEIVIEFLTPVTDSVKLEVQTEQRLTGEQVSLIGREEDGQIRGIHAKGVVRESGHLHLKTDSSLVATVITQSGVKRESGASAGKGAPLQSDQSWVFSGQTGLLVLQLKPVEPRLLVDHGTQISLDDDQLRLTSSLNYTVERAGVFQLQLSYPDSLTIDTVQADGMTEFQVDKATGKLTLSLAQKRMGSVRVNITAHQNFDSQGEDVVTEIPSMTPLGIERETGRIDLFAPQFLDVSTVDGETKGLFPTEHQPGVRSGRLTAVGSWKYSQRPFQLKVRTTPRPAQLAATVLTAADVQPEVIKVHSEITYTILNAGLNTFRLSVPEQLADDIRFRMISGGPEIQQRIKGTETIDGRVIWTLILQNEVSGQIKLAAEWEHRLRRENGSGENESVSLSPVQVLPPYDENSGRKRRVTLTQTRGEIVLRRHQSLSIEAEQSGESIEKIDVRETELGSSDGNDLAFRYFSQPADVTVAVREHAVHEVVSTVISRAAIEIVTDRQSLAHYRARLLLRTSERQRLRVDLPAGADLQTPLIGTSRTTFEKADDVTPHDGWEAYYLNIGRSSISNESFLITLQFRCPIADEYVLPYEGRGSRQILRLPVIGDGSGDTVVQETRVALWTPNDVSIIGEPEGWATEGPSRVLLTRPFTATNSPQAASEMEQWIGQDSAASNFATQGNVTVFRAIGLRSQLQFSWWHRPFLVAVVSGTLLFVGLILRHTTWENRLTILVITALAAAIWSLNDHVEVFQFVSAGSYGLIAVATIWVIGLLSPAGKHHASSPADSRQEKLPPVEAIATSAEHQASDDSPDCMAGSAPPGTVSPSPEVSQWMKDLMGGKD
ncbi:MAG: hypothetical protein KDA81_06310 [Planctomycetaceae bacterium]|nr:hypothetical protein [Planctomycetaceae bacterium]